jgi:hypothetical protein
VVGYTIHVPSLGRKLSVPSNKVTMVDDTNTTDTGPQFGKHSISSSNKSSGKTEKKKNWGSSSDSGGDE